MKLAICLLLVSITLPAQSRTVISGCTITALKPAMIYVYESAVQPGTVNVLAGAYEGSIYSPTLDHIQLSGSGCSPVELDQDRFLADFGRMIWLGAYRIPHDGAPLKGLFAAALPDWYRLRQGGLEAVGFTPNVPGSVQAAAR